MNSSSKYGAETGIQNELALRHSRNVVNCRALFKGIVPPSGCAKTDFPVADGKKIRLRDLSFLWSVGQVRASRHMQQPVEHSRL